MFNMIADAAAQAAQSASQSTQSAQTAAKAAPGGVAGLLGNPMILMIVVFVVMIFFMSRSQKKQQRKREEMLDALAKGAEVMLASGIFGTIAEVQGDSFIVQIAEGVKIKVAKNGIADVVKRADGSAK